MRHFYHFNEVLTMIDTDISTLRDIISYNRPLPNREFDQIYMLTNDMLLQSEYVGSLIKERDVVFLGDGDNMSLLLAALAQNNLVERANSMMVLDFDERILNNISLQSQKLKLAAPNIYTQKYNIINPIQSEHINKFDFFYINPPYGSKNNGLSTILWLERCIDLCSSTSLGCIIIPYDIEQKWTIENMINIQSFLLNKGFAIRDMKSYFHRYHLEDNPNLKSASIIVERFSTQSSRYTGQRLPKECLINLYGSPRKIPQYILSSDKNPLGIRDYEWEYGQHEFWIAKSDVG